MCCPRGSKLELEAKELQRVVRGWWGGRPEGSRRVGGWVVWIGALRPANKNLHVGRVLKCARGPVRAPTPQNVERNILEYVAS